MNADAKPNDYLSVQKALQILMAFLPHNQEMGTIEISERLGLHKSTASRLLNVLTRYGFLQQDAKSRKFRLGVMAAKIGLTIQQSVSEQLIGLAQPFIDELRNEIGETVALEIWLRNTTILAYRAEAQRSRRMFLLQPGDPVDVHVSAGSRVILAHSALRVIEDALIGPFKKYTSHTVTDPEAIKAQLSNIRQDGYFISKGERHPDSHVIAVPIFNYAGEPVAAIALFSTPDRLPRLLETDLLERLKKSAEQISSKLLYCAEY